MTTVETWAYNNAVEAQLLKSKTIEVLVCQSILTSMECHLQNMCSICYQDNRGMCTHNDNKNDKFFSNCLDKSTTNIYDLSQKNPFL